MSQAFSRISKHIYFQNTFLQRLVWSILKKYLSLPLTALLLRWASCRFLKLSAFCSGWGTILWNLLFLSLVLLVSKNAGICSGPSRGPSTKRPLHVVPMLLSSLVFHIRGLSFQGGLKGWHCNQIFLTMPHMPIWTGLTWQFLAGSVSIPPEKANNTTIGAEIPCPHRPIPL